MRLLSRGLLLLPLAIVAGACAEHRLTDAASANGAERSARVALSATLSPAALRTSQALAGRGITVNNVRVVLVRPPADTLKDTLVTVGPGQESISLEVSVPLRGIEEQLGAVIQLREGTQVLFSGAQTVLARVATLPPVAPPSPLELTYVGPGASVRRVVVAPHDVTTTSSAVQFTATGFDEAGVSVADVVFTWSTGDARVATVDARGLLHPVVLRGATTVRAVTPNGISDQATVRIVPPPSKLGLVSGSGQVAAAGRALPQPIVVEVKAADDVGVPEVPVSIRVVSGGGSVPADPVLTGADGRASFTPTLGRTAGDNRFEISAGSLPLLAASATGVAGPPSTLVVVSGNGQSAQVGNPLDAPLVVRVTDDFGNATPGATVAWTRTAGAGAVSPATSTADAAGLAQATYRAGPTTGTETIRASLAGGAAVTFTATTRAGDPAKMQIVSGNGQSAAVNTAVAAPLVVRVFDAAGNPAENARITWAVTSGEAEVADAVSTTSSDGSTSMTVRMGRAAGEVEVTARVGTSDIAVSFRLRASAGPVASLFKQAGDNQGAAPGTAVAIAPTVVARDAYGNAVSLATVTFTVVSGGGTVTGATARTNGAGAASVGSWVMGTSGAQVLRAATLGASAEFTASISGGGTGVFGAGSIDGGPSTFYRLDKATGAATAIGPIGFNRVGGMDFHPATGVLYATATEPATLRAVLITINTTTGAGTLVGPLNGHATIGDVSFRSDGTLFVYDAYSSDHTMYTASLTTGTLTLVGSTGLRSNGGNGIVFAADGTLYHSNRNNAHTISTSTGRATAIATISAPSTCLSARAAAVARDPATSQFIAVVKCGSGGSQVFLGRINFTSGVITLTGPTTDGMDAIAIR